MYDCREWQHLRRDADAIGLPAAYLQNAAINGLPCCLSNITVQATRKRYMAVEEGEPLAPFKLFKTCMKLAELPSCLPRL